MNKKYLLILTLFLSPLVHSAPELKGYPDELKSFLYPDKRTVTIRSSATEKGYSDKAIISLVITTEEDKLSDAVKKNGLLRAKVSEALTTAGIKPDNIKTSKFSTSPQFGWFGDEPDSYQIVNRMAVSIFSESELNAITTIADANKEVSFSSTVFEHTLKDEFKEKVKKKALMKVMVQKSFYEQELGLKLKPIAFRDFDIAESGTMAAREFGNIVTITGSRLKREKRSSSRDYNESTSVVAAQTFDEIEYSATISVDFEIVSDK